MSLLITHQSGLFKIYVSLACYGQFTILDILLFVKRGEVGQDSSTKLKFGVVRYTTTAEPRRASW